MLHTKLLSFRENEVAVGHVLLEASTRPPKYNSGNTVSRHQSRAPASPPGVARPSLAGAGLSSAETAACGKLRDVRIFSSVGRGEERDVDRTDSSGEGGTALREADGRRRRGGANGVRGVVQTGRLMVPPQKTTAAKSMAVAARVQGQDVVTCRPYERAAALVPVPPPLRQVLSVNRPPFDRARPRATTRARREIE